MQKQNKFNSPQGIGFIYYPEFIPYYPHMKVKYNLTNTEILVYGLIRFNSPRRWSEIKGDISLPDLAWSVNSSISYVRFKVIPSLIKKGLL